MSRAANGTQRAFKIDRFTDVIVDRTSGIKNNSRVNGLKFEFIQSQTEASEQQGERIVINVSTDAETLRVIDSIVLGFCSDPILRWLYPEPQEYLANAPNIINLYGGGAFQHDSAYHIQNYTGAALWLPPDIHPDEEGLTKIFQDGFDGAQLDEIFSIFEQMDNFHPDEVCWHLAFIAVDPAHQNKGYGSTLLKHTLEAVDNDKKMAYLESTNEANLSLYRRHGFELVGNIQAGNSPSLFPMIRESR